MSAEIRPRTDEERQAYISGMAAAINMVDEHGIEFARQELRLLTSMEAELDARKMVSVGKSCAKHGPGWMTDT